MPVLKLFCIPGGELDVHTERRKPFPAATVKPQDQDPTVGISPILVVGGVGASEMRKLRVEERRNMSNLYLSDGDFDARA